MIKPSTKTFWLFAGLSICLHAILFVTWFSPSIKQAPVGEQKKPINIHLLTKNTLKNEENNHIKPVKNNKNTRTKHAENPSPPNLSKTNHKPTQYKAEKTSNVLYKLLYGAINSNKHYPLAALRLQRQGTVSVAFKLLNSGVISNLKISKSSGFNMLDHAALLAVKRIQPFQPAEKYITSTHDFNIDIVFQL